MAPTEAQRRAHKEYFSKSYTQIKLAMPNKEAEALRAYCSEHGLTVAGFIRKLIKDAIQAGSVPPGGSEAGQVGNGCPRK